MSSPRFEPDEHGYIYCDGNGDGPVAVEQAEYVVCWCAENENCEVLPPKEVGPDLSDCPYYQHTKGGPIGKCNRWCYTEPMCIEEDWLV